MKTIENFFLKGSEKVRQQIISVALERFAHFGIEKTTMYEIAKAADITTVCLASHFVNKQDLINEIGKEIIQEESAQLSHLVHKDTPTLQALYRLLEIKDKTRRKYSRTQILYNRGAIYAGLPETLIKLIKTVEIRQLSRIFKRGIENGELINFSIQHIASLYAEILHGLVIGAGTKINSINMGSGYLPEEILEKQKEITSIFINGLRPPLSQEAIRQYNN